MIKKLSTLALRPLKSLYPGQHAPIISANLWEKANKAIKLRFPKHEFRKKEETNKLIDLALNGGVSQGSVYRERIDKLQSEVGELEKAKRPDGEVKASDENDLCVGSTSHQRWLPHLDEFRNWLMTLSTSSEGLLFSHTISP